MKWIESSVLKFIKRIAARKRCFSLVHIVQRHGRILLQRRHFRCVFFLFRTMKMIKKINKMQQMLQVTSNRRAVFPLKIWRVVISVGRNSKFRRCKFQYLSNFYPNYWLVWWDAQMNTSFKFCRSLLTSIFTLHFCLIADQPFSLFAVFFSKLYLVPAN